MPRANRTATQAEKTEQAVNSPRKQKNSRKRQIRTPQREDLFISDRQQTPGWLKIQFSQEAERKLRNI